MTKRDFASSGTEERYLPELLIQPVHKEIRINIDISSSKAEATVKYTLKANKDNSTKIELDAWDLEISCIESEKKLRWDYNSRKISIIFDNPLMANSETSVTIKYRVIKPVAGIYFYYPDELYPDRKEFMFVDNETEKARYWLPSIDHPAVRYTIDFFISSRPELTVLANGRLINKSPNPDGTLCWHWNLDIPCPTYLTNFVIGDLHYYQDREVDLGYGKIPLRYYSTKDHSPEELKLSFDRSPEMLEWLYGKLKVPLRYPKYYQYVTPHSFGAMENISLVSWEDSFVLDEIYAREYAQEVDEVNVHEMAHSWFGNLVGSRDFAHSWLKEGWATYMEAVWFEDNYNQNEFYYRLFEFSETYFEESGNAYSRPIVYNRYDSSWDLFDGHMYPGAAMRIHMLRRYIGDSDFWEATTDYLKTFSDKTVETVDFQRIMEKHTSLSLQKFFDRWIYRNGYPELKASFEYDDQKNISTLKIEQAQANEDSPEKLFHFTLDIKVELEADKYEIYQFEIRKREHNFYFKTDKKPEQILFDPDFKILFSLDFNPGNDILKNHLLKGDLRSKILAARELSKEGGHSNLSSLKEAYLKENYWGIKRHFARALADSENFTGIEALLEILPLEKTPRLIRHIISNLHTSRDPKISQAMKEYLNRVPLLYDASAEALEVIGSQHNSEDFDYLKNFPVNEDKHGIILGAKYTAIGNLRSKEAFEFLMEKVVYGAEKESVRTSIIEALAKSALWMDKNDKIRASELLSDILRKENNELILKTTVSALSSLKLPETIPVLEMSKSKLEHGEHPFISRAINSVEEYKDSASINKLKSDFEKLRDTNRKLLERLEKLEFIINEDKSGN